MKIKDFFKKDINRNIETVIKADDRDHISEEVVEYVVTKEISKKIGDFFQQYNDYSGANGVWISGFFGSGKSHLLKILSYVLENKETDGYKAGELFAEKIEDDEMLKGDVLAANRFPSESILFNIDQQSQITSKSDANAILSVFYKVFFDHLGYYGFMTHVAEFEMWLDKQGNYDTFKSKFESKNGKSWEVAREDYFDPLVTEDVAEVLGEINNTDSSKYSDILDDIEERQKQSIEDFCERVHDYIKQKPSGFRLNFFVDEVGQYISDNTKLMLNLQTIAETLATRTKGQSWILVTSQEDMEKVVGDMNKQQQNDFSRIQARFKIKIPLTSANVDEVIEKRLLAKEEEPEKVLAGIWKSENSHLDTLLSFSDVGVQFKGYADQQDFINKYPFVAYQFDLFQQCRRALSTHNAFQGKHASVGERSMLGVFQQVTKYIEDRDSNSLVSFEMMYEGIRNELRGEIQSSITLAERNLDNDFAIRVLKALFMVKYFSNFKTTKRNISVLMIDDMKVDLKEHDRKIEEALNILENQSYLQRTGEIYEFLTDDEKDVEQEIKATEIDESAVTTFLKDIFFDEIIRDNRIKFTDNKYDYEYTSKVDGTVFGREKELEVEIITPNYYDYENITAIQAQTMGTPIMRVVLPADPVFIKDLKLYLRTDKYVKQNRSTGNRPEVKRILQEKAEQNAIRRRNLIQLGNKHLSASDVYMNGGKHAGGSSSDGRTKIFSDFQDLVKIAYPNLRMLGSAQYSEDTIKNTIRSTQDDLFGSDDRTMTEAESEILNLINRRKKQSDRTSLNDVRDAFTRKPYGWYPNAIWTVVAKLYKRGKIEVRQNTNLLEDDDVLNALMNSKNYGSALLEPQADYDPRVVKELKQVYSEAFDETCNLQEAKDVGIAFKEKLTELAIDIDKLLVSKSNYPFLESLEPISERLNKLTNKEYSYYLTNLKDFEDDLLDTKEDLINPIKTFWNGEQKRIYDDIRTVIDGDRSNLEYVEGDELKTIKEVYNHSKPYTGSLIKDAKSAKDRLVKKVTDLIEDERTDAIEMIDKEVKDFTSLYDYTQLPEEKGKSLLVPLQEERKKLEKQRFIANIRDAKDRIVNEIVPAQLTELSRLKEVQETGSEAAEAKHHYINKTAVKVEFDKWELKSEEDVEEYIEAYKKTLLDLIRNNKRISLK